MKISKIVASALLSTTLSVGLWADVEITVEPNLEKLSLTDTWDKTFAQSEGVNHKKVTFRNRYGITLAADLYTPKTISGKMPAVAVGGPFGAVKEQASGLYAQELAKRGFVALAFDPSYTGESGGKPRNIASTDINTEDFSAAVDFLGIQNFVDPEKISILGICGFGGFALNAGAMDTRIAKIVTVTMYDMSRLSAKGYNDSINANQRLAKKKELNALRFDDAKNRAPAPSADILPDKLTGKEPGFVVDYYNYYKTQRGYHHRSINSNSAWSAYTAVAIGNSPILAYASDIKAPVLMIHGEKAHSKYFSEDTFKLLKGERKELLIVPGANHTDLYDDARKIPFDKIEEFLK